MADQQVNSSELNSLDPTPTAAPMATGTVVAAPPARPPRPLSPKEEAKTTLKEAFPNVDENVIEAVLVASGGQIEPAFNALLGMSDPTYKPEPADVVPRHSSSHDSPAAFPTSTPMTQLEQDEQLARQLAGEGRPRRQGRRSSREQQPYSAQQQPGQGKDHSFLDDDLPIIKDNIKKGWSTFMGKVKSRLDGEPEQPPPQPPRPGEYGYHQQSSRYDSDPRVLGDDFSHLNLQDQSRGDPARRPLANPNLFKSARFSNSETEGTPPVKPPRPEQQTSAASSTPVQSQTQSTGGPSPNKKWEPLRPAEDRDPFALGDSDDEDGKDDLYGTAPVKSGGAPIGTQESGLVATPLDSAISGSGPKTS